MASCRCLCHSPNRGNQRACAHAGRFLEAFAWAQQAVRFDEPVSDTDPLEAAVACDGCRKDHCAALRTPIRMWWNPKPAVVEQPDPDVPYRVWREQGEGPEA